MNSRIFHRKKSCADKKLSPAKTPAVLLLVLYGVWLAFVFPFARPAGAHPLNNGYSNITVEQTAAAYRLFLPEVSVAALFDPDHDGTLTEAELNGQRQAMEDYLRDHLRLENDGRGMTLHLLSVGRDEKDAIPGITFDMRYESDAKISDLTIYYNLLFDDADPNHINFMLIQQGNDMDQYVFEDGDRSFHYENPAGLAEVLGQYLKLGIEHILTGYDHLLFLLSLLVAASCWKDIVKIVTAFTLAHSITLIAAALGVIPLNARLVESAIALTICYVAAENVFILRMNRRWMLAFFLGLIHGMGFAGALGEIGLSKKHLLASLLTFNVGVELGQLAVVAIVLPILLHLRRFPWYRRVVISGVSICIFVLALFWFLQRSGIV